MLKNFNGSLAEYEMDHDPCFPANEIEQNMTINVTIDLELKNFPVTTCKDGQVNEDFLQNIIETHLKFLLNDKNMNIEEITVTNYE